MLGRMMISLPIKVFLLLLLMYSTIVVQGTLTPNGAFSFECGSRQTFTCRVPGKPLGWNIAGLRGINIPGPFRARVAALINPRITSDDTGGDTQVSVSDITISEFSISDNGGTIQCINMEDGSVQGMASISVGSLPIPSSTNVTATIGSCNDVTLQWTQPSEPNDITTSVSCTPPSPGCTTCTTSPCTITGLSSSTEYVFTVTFYSGQCRINMSKTAIMTWDSRVPSCPTSVVAVSKGDNDVITIIWQQPSNTPPATDGSITYYPTSSPYYCVDSMNCTSPCTISGLHPGTEYQFTVIPNNNCGSPTGCTGNTATFETASKISLPKIICTSQSVLLLAGIIPTVGLLLAQVATGVVVFLLTRHCYKKTSQKSSSKHEVVHEQVEGHITYEHIAMTESLAYVSVNQK